MKLGVGLFVGVHEAVPVPDRVGVPVGVCVFVGVGVHEALYVYVLEAVPELESLGIADRVADPVAVAVAVAVEVAVAGSDGLLVGVFEGVFDGVGVKHWPSGKIHWSPVSTPPCGQLYVKSAACESLHVDPEREPPRGHV